MTAAGRVEVAEGVRRLGGLDDLPGGGQVYVEGRHAYVGHMNPPHGTSVIDISDPRAPRVVAHLPPPDDGSHTHKVRVVGDVMVTNVEQADRHTMRRAALIAPMTDALRAEFGREPSDAEIAARIGVSAEKMPKLRASLAAPYADGGFRVWDVRDPAAPRLLSCVRTGGVGVHRFDLDGRFAYISTEMAGYVGNILVVYDMADPAAPREVGRYAAPGQHVAAGETPDWPGQKHRLHHALRFGDELWAAWWHEGFRVLDARDLSAMREIGLWRRPAAFHEPTHTVLPLAGLHAGRRYAVAVDEEHDHTRGQPHAFLWVMDVTDLSDIRPAAVFDVGESDSPYARAGLRFGAHQPAERWTGDVLPVAWFAGGLRLVDLSNPLAPREAGCFIPAPRGGAAAPQTNDVAMDDRGLILMIDRLRGLDIVEPA